MDQSVTAALLEAKHKSQLKTTATTWPGGTGTGVSHGCLPVHNEQQLKSMDVEKGDLNSFNEYAEFFCIFIH